MSYLEFKAALSPFKVFSLGDIRKTFPFFDSKRLVEWQEKKYIIKIINKWYLFSDISPDEHLLYRISNCIYHPSYISLQSALSYHQLIPEAVYSPQAVSTRKTIAYDTSVGYFNYQTVRPALYFGYTVLHPDGLPVLMASPEKAILDYLYLNAQVRDLEDIIALRLNISVLQTKLNWDIFATYAMIFDSSVLDKRIKLLKKFMLNAYTA